MGFILFIIASVLKWILAPLLYTYGAIYSIKNKELLKWHKDLAISKDQHGNVLGKFLFNKLLIKSCGYKFGNPDETISSVIGKNELNNTLSQLGLILAYILNKLDPGHTKKAIE